MKYKQVNKTRSVKQDRGSILSFTRKFLYAMVLGTFIFLTLGGVPSAVSANLQPVNHKTISSPIRSGLTDTAELQAFLDAFFADKMEELNIPGAALVMVKDGDIFFMKGYGYADLEKQIPVDPERTIFRVGSISKPVTFTAVMQLAEKNLLDLDTDVNRYLTDFQIQATYTEPITMHHLMTHTSGFEDRWIGYKTYDEEAVVEFGDFIKSNIPARVYEPGSIYSYSNYGADLAGYIVEQVSGNYFEEYMDQNIFQPLGMTRSTFRQPIPDYYKSDVATGYRYHDGKYEADTFIYSHATPAGGLSTTAADMAAFMIAHLQDGQYRDVRILEEVSAQRMHEQQFTHHPDLPGMTYGFKEREINGEYILEHGGDLHTFAAEMVLLPERNEGFFLVYNSFSDAFREDFIRAFFDRYYPPQTRVEAPIAIDMTQEDLSRFTGYYRWVKYSHTTIDKLITLVPGPYWISIKADEKGGLLVSFFGAKAEWHYVPVAPLVFKQVSGGLQKVDNLKLDPGDTLVFREDENNQITFGFLTFQNTAFHKLSWYEMPEVMLGTFGVLIIIFLSYLILWPIIMLVRRLFGRRSSNTTASKWALLLAGITSGLNLVFIVGLFLTFGEKLVFGMNPIIPFLMVIPLVTAAMTLIMLVMIVVSWKNGYWSIPGRIHYTFLTLASLLFIIWTNYWNIIGFRF